MKNIFERASKMRLRISTHKGFITIDDLWGLPLTSAVGQVNLDDLAKTLNKSIAEDDVSFVEVPAKQDTTGKLAFEIVKHVISVKLAEREATKKAVQKKERKQKILEILARKQDSKLEETSEEDLQKMLEEL